MFNQSMLNRSVFNRSTRICELMQGTCASEIAEFAAVLPILFMILIGIFWFGQAFRIYGTITHAAREGARAAVAPTCATCSGSNPPASNAWNAVQAAMTAAKLDPTQLSQPSTLPPVFACLAGGSSQTVDCDKTQANICVQGTSGTLVALSTTASGGAGTCGVSVSFQYPYSFWLPGASIGSRTINLYAQAEMRSETQ